MGLRAELTWLGPFCRAKTYQGHEVTGLLNSIWQNPYKYVNKLWPLRFKGKCTESGQVLTGEQLHDKADQA